jgi:hypothetical protein
MTLLQNSSEECGSKGKEQSRAGWLLLGRSGRARRAARTADGAWGVEAESGVSRVGFTSLGCTRK